MFLKKCSFLALLSVFILSACSNDNTATVDDTTPIEEPEEPVVEVIPTSSDVSYTSASTLGSNVNDPVAIDSGPEVSVNGLELYFHSNRVGGSGGMDLFVSTRASITDDWGVANNLAVLNTAENDRSPAISYDGLTLYFASDRVGTHGFHDLYMSTRPTLSDPWAAPVNLGVDINTIDEESSPDISVDGLSLYFLSDTAGGYGLNDIYVSTRASVFGEWPMPVNLGELINSADYEAAPEIASDGLTLYFHSDRDDPLGAHNIWRSKRATTSDAWGTPRALPAPVNSAYVDVEPGLSYDWQTLYFATGVDKDSLDIWKAVP